MKIKTAAAAALCAVVTLSCSAPAVRTEKNSGAPVIRCVNVRALYETMKARSEKAGNISAEKEKVRQEIENIQEALLVSPDERKASIEKIKRLRDRYADLEGQEASIKAEILKKINQALAAVASDTGVDFVLNMGDEVIYARGKYDITEDVLREIVKSEKRSAPAVR